MRIVIEDPAPSVAQAIQESLLGVAGVVQEAQFTNKPWDGNRSRFSVDQLRQAVPAACRKHGDQLAKAAGRPPAKGDYKLPIKEPDGTVNANALAAALAALHGGRGGVDLPSAVAQAAADEITKLQQQYKNRGENENYSPLTTATQMREYLECVGDVPVHLCVEGVVSNYTPLSISPGATGSRCKIVIITAGVSKNRNDWTLEVLEKAVHLFEGAKVFYDHRDSDKRSFRDFVGKLEDVTMEGNDMVGYLKTHSGAEWFRKVATEMPEDVGFSVYVYAYSQPQEDGTEKIKEIISVRSVDVVDTPSAGGKILSVMERASRSLVGPREEENVNEVEKLRQENEALKARLTDQEKVATELTKRVVDLCKLQENEEGMKRVRRRLQHAKDKGMDIRGPIEQDILEAFEGKGMVEEKVIDDVITRHVERAKALVEAYKPTQEETPKPTSTSAAVPPAPKKAENQETKEQKTMTAKEIAAGIIYSEYMGLEVKE